MLEEVKRLNSELDTKQVTFNFLKTNKNGSKAWRVKAKADSIYTGSVIVRFWIEA